MEQFSEVGISELDGTKYHMPYFIHSLALNFGVN